MDRRVIWKLPEIFLKRVGRYILTFSSPPSCHLLGCICSILEHEVRGANPFKIWQSSNRRVLGSLGSS